ncbi:phage tail family protein [Ornithinibacillus bavariensis]|uniref:Phage tail family protein n=1 Tax=Ornithinibacillus bavariensis TaxID=545502 RepID=A0A919X835_9BACI|nr:phage tail family protein [Ornithinibacillus bavariensis]GIO27722.1 hypothetical protein J43TS3_23330 [Ornithinibacillus bavariensis]
MIRFSNSRGQSIEFKEGCQFRIFNIDGVGGSDVDVQLQSAPYQDGATHIDSILEPRSISIEFGIFANNKKEIYELRRYISEVFNPKFGIGTLFLNYGGVSFEIEATAESGPNFPGGSTNETSRFQRGMLSLICPNPYWKSEQITEAPTFEALFEFPFEGAFEMGIQRDLRTIINDGDAPTPIQIEFYGPATNPIVINNTTGEFIKVNQRLQEGEYMRIDTTPGDKSVFFVSPDGTERNVFNWIDLESTFFLLQIGENEIEYSADSDIQGAIFNIYYSKQYVGV